MLRCPDHTREAADGKPLSFLGFPHNHQQRGMKMRRWVSHCNLIEIRQRGQSSARPTKIKPLMIRPRIKIGNAKRGSRNQTPAPSPGPPAPVFTANNTTMSLGWTYNGAPCDRFHVFQHLPNQAAGVFADWKQVDGGLRTCGTDFDSPADATGYKFYLVPEKGDPEDGEDKPVTSPSNIVNFSAG